MRGPWKFSTQTFCQWHLSLGYFPYLILTKLNPYDNHYHDLLWKYCKAKHPIASSSKLLLQSVQNIFTTLFYYISKFLNLEVVHSFFPFHLSKHPNSVPFILSYTQFLTSLIKLLHCKNLFIVFFILIFPELKKILLTFLNLLFSCSFIFNIKEIKNLLYSVILLPFQDKENVFC